MIYLDYNASHPIRDSAKQSVMEAFELCGNPSSIHGCGRKTRNLVDNARKFISDSLGADRVIFTSGGTESNNLILKNFDANAISSVEHDSVTMAALEPLVIPVNSGGIIDLEALREAAQKLPKGSLFSICLANNETGIIQPIKQISEVVKEFHHFIHTDASQAIGRIPVNMTDIDVDFMTISGHKFGGPIGVGALLLRDQHQLTPILNGGGQEFGMRSGTIAFPLIHGMARALELSLHEIELMKDVQKLRDDMELQIDKRAIIHGQKSSRLPNTSCISMPGVKSESQVINFDLFGIAISAGSACSSGKIKSSKTLISMGVEDDLASSAIRVSIGHKTSAQDIAKFVKQWSDIMNRHKE